MATCMYMFRTRSKYTNDYHSITQICKLVRHADSELIICIKPTYNPTNLQLIPYACHEIFTLIRWNYKATPKLRYLPSICHAASNSIIDIQPEKATKQLQIHTCLHAYLYLYVPYIKQICQSLSFQYTSMYFNETYSFWIYHTYSTNFQTYKHTTYSLWLAW